MQELNSHLLCVSEDHLAPFSLKKLFHHLSQIAPSSPNLGKPGLPAKKPARKHMQAPDPIRLYRAAKRQVKAAALNLNHLLETQKRLTATKDGPFTDPGSPPTVLALPFAPPSWAAVMTGGYRHHRIRRQLHANHPPSRKETIRRTYHNSSRKGVSTRRHNNACFASRAEFRRANRCKTPRSCARGDLGPGRRPRSAGPPHATPSRSSDTPSRLYRHGGYRHGGRDDDDRGRLPPPPPNPPRGDLPDLKIRCHYSDHKGQCERICTLHNKGQIRYRVVRKHTTLTFCTADCMGSFIILYATSGIH